MIIHTHKGLNNLLKRESGFADENKYKSQLVHHVSWAPISTGLGFASRLVFNAR